MKISEIVTTPRAVLIDVLINDHSKEHTVTDLCEKSGLSRPTVYNELKTLKQKRFVSQRGGKPKYYKANTENDIIKALMKYERVK